MARHDLYDPGFDCADAADGDERGLLQRQPKSAGSIAEVAGGNQPGRGGLAANVYDDRSPSRAQWLVSITASRNASALCDNNRRSANLLVTSLHIGDAE